MPNSMDGLHGKNRQGADPSQTVMRLFLNHLTSLDALCHDLEMIADGLPASIDAQTSLVIAGNIVPIISSAHKFEEEHIYPILLNAVRNGATMKVEIDRLKTEHWIDSDLGEEISLALKEYVSNQNPVKAETLSWMLRGFFESMRRHIAFEHAVILPVVRKKLGSKNA